MSFGNEDFPKIYYWDNTLISTGLACRRRLYWFLRGLRPKSPPPYFAFGRAWGAIQNEWHSLQGEDISLKERMQRALRKGEEIWREGDHIPDGSNSWENLEELFLHYVQHYGEEEQWKVIGGELGFTFPIPDSDYFYCGAIDTYIYWKGYGTLLKEDKTTGGYISNSYVEQYKYSSQITGYVWALSQLTGEVPMGALVDIASKRSRKDPSDRFLRVLETRSKWKVESFIEETKVIIDDLLGEWNRWVWPKDGERDNVLCSGGMGKGACPYKSLCALEGNPWDPGFEEYRYEEFSLADWKPWERKGEG